MTTSTSATPTFTFHSGRSSAPALFLAALCALILTAFLVDVQRGVTSPDATAAELRAS